MKKIITIILVAVTALAATSCLEHKVLGSFFGRFPQNVQLKYDFSKLNLVQIDDPTVGTLIPGNNQGRGTWWVYAYPHAGNPDRQMYRFPISEWDNETQTMVSHPENAEGAFLPIFDYEGHEHYRGVYDFLVCNMPLHEDPETLQNNIAHGENLEELESVVDVQSEVYFPGFFWKLVLPSQAPFQDGNEFVAPCRDLQFLQYGVVKNELVPGSNVENTTHGPVNVPIDMLKTRHTKVDVPTPGILKTGWTVMKPIFMVTGLAETWMFSKGKVGDTKYTVTYQTWSMQGFDDICEFNHYGRHPSASKVELYVIYILCSPMTVSSTASGQDVYMCYRKFDITSEIDANKEEFTLDGIKWMPVVEGRTPFEASQTTVDWLEIK